MSDRIDPASPEQETVASLNRLIDAVMGSLKGTTGKPWVGTIHSLADALAMDGWTRNNPMMALESRGVTPELEDDDDDDERPWAPYHPYHVASGCTNSARGDGIHTPGRGGKQWRICVDCDEWPFVEEQPTANSTRESINDFNRAYVNSLRTSAQLAARERTWRGDCV